MMSAGTGKNTVASKPQPMPPNCSQTESPWAFGPCGAGESLQYLNRNRFYRPDIGRFLSRDKQVRKQLYNYVDNQPIGLVDPNGLQGVAPPGTHWQDRFGRHLPGLGCVWNLADEALFMSSLTGLGNQPDGPRDAFRHCYWMCISARQCGYAAAWAAGTGHESYGHFDQSNFADLANNSVGLGCSDRCDCFSCCKEAYNANQLIVINP